MIFDWIVGLSLIIGRAPPVSRMRCSVQRSGTVHRWSGTAADRNGPGSAAHHCASLHAALRPGHESALVLQEGTNDSF